MAGDAIRLRDALLVILTVTTGATDATAFERVGHVFASVITGNLILLGASAVSTNGSLALSCACALGGYALGAFITAPRRDRDGAVWPVGTTRALGLDLALLAAFGLGWEIVGGRPSRSIQIVLLALAAGAMGAQSSAVRRLGQMSTTYLTSTLTGLVESIARRRWSDGDSRGVAILGAATCGAAAGTALLLYAPAWLPALQLLPVVIVVIASRRLAAGYPAS